MPEPVRLRRGLVFATDLLEPLPALAGAAERAGLDRVWTTEYEGRDALLRALAIALATERIGVGTGIAYAFARAPRALAAGAADLARLSGGRFALGIGPGTPGIRRRYGAEFEPPAPRLAACVAALRETWAEGPVERTGPPPVYGAAMLPAMARTVAASCDGALLHALALAPVHLHERLLPALREGLERRAGGPAPELVAWCVTAIDADERAARERARAQLAFYLATPSFAAVAAGAAWERGAARVREAFAASGRSPDWAGLAALVPDSAVEELAIWGDADRARELAARRESELAPLGITELAFQPASAAAGPEGARGECERIAAALGSL